MYDVLIYFADPESDAHEYAVVNPNGGDVAIADGVLCIKYVDVDHPDKERVAIYNMALIESVVIEEQ